MEACSLIQGGHLLVPAARPIHHLLGIHAAGFHRYEIPFAEAILLKQLCKELHAFFWNKHLAWFKTIKLTLKEEDMLLDAYFLRSILEDTLAAGTYDLEGIARYTYHDSEIIEDILLQRNPRPSIILLQRILDLHQSVRPELYIELRKKVLAALQDGKT